MLGKIYHRAIPSAMFGFLSEPDVGHGSFDLVTVERKASQGREHMDKAFVRISPTRRETELTTATG